MRIGLSTFTFAFSRFQNFDHFLEQAVEGFTFGGELPDLENEIGNSFEIKAR